jgi:hypothetical protein
MKTGNTILAGTIELHLQTSGWKTHRHESDNHYRNVIRHVAYEHNEKENDIPVLELSSRSQTYCWSNMSLS